MNAAKELDAPRLLLRQEAGLVDDDGSIYLVLHGTANDNGPKAAFDPFNTVGFDDGDPHYFEYNS